MRRWLRTSAATRRRSTTRSRGSSGRCWPTRRRAKCSSRNGYSRDLVVGGKSNPALLAISCRLDSKRGLHLHGEVVDRYEIDACGLRTIDREVIDLAVVIAARFASPEVVPVTTADGKADRTRP